MTDAATTDTKVETTQTDTTKTDATAKTIIDTGAADTTAADQTGKSPDTTGATGAADAPDWRTKLAGEDATFRKTLERYADESAFGKAHRALLTKMQSGEMKKALPEGASPEEVTTWRKENGIPEKVEGYVEALKLPDGLIIGEADKPIVAQFADAALASNMAPGQFNSLVAKYYAMQDAQKVQQAEADATFHQQSDDALRADWQGADYRKNLTAIQNMMATWSDGLATRVLTARGPDGRLMGDDPGFVKQMAQLARELNPAATLVPAGTSDPGKTLAGELESIRDLRRNKPDEYNANVKKYEAREIEIIDALSQTKQRAA